MEGFIDQIDNNGRLIAKRPVGDLKKQMFMHRAVLIIPMGEHKTLILSKRAMDKHPFPNTWCAAVGGKVNHGESEEKAATREMKEEIGKSYPMKKVTSFIYDRPDYKAIFTVFTTLIPIPESKLTLDPKEIQYVNSFSKAQIIKMMNENPHLFAPTFIVAIKAALPFL